MFSIEEIGNAINEIDKNRKEDKRVYVYMGRYVMIDGVAKITYNSDDSYVYKKYRDIESGTTLTVNKRSVEAFEKGKKIIFPVVEDYTPEAYEETFKVIKETYNKESSSSNKEEAYKLIKRLTPLK